jgi:hypothetical protein
MGDGCAFPERTSSETVGRSIALVLNQGDPMIVAKRIVAGLVLLLSAAMLLLSLAGGIGVLMAREPATVKATDVFERIDFALDIADKKLAFVKTALARATERLESARKDQREIARQQKGGFDKRRFLAQSVQQLIAPELGNANEKLHTVAEAAVVVNTVLEDVGNMPFLAESGLDLDQLSDMNNRLGEMVPTAWELSRLLGDPKSDSEAANQLTKMDRVLNTLRGFATDFEARLTEVRQQTNAVKAKLLFWITPAAILIAAICFWIAFSQVFLLARAWSWLRR